MPVTGLNHINIRTTDLDATLDFYTGIFSFTHTERPMVRGHVAHWLHDANGMPIIHIRVLELDGESTGAIDHVALTCTDLEEIIKRLEARDIPHRIGTGIVDADFTQVFLKDPHGITLELNFLHSEG